ADSGDYDVLVVDRMLPKRDGLSLIGALREKGNRTPVLILSALGQVDDRIKGLRAGGDDYLPKPYSFAELLARVEVLSRRLGGPAEETTYKVGDLELDRLSHRVARGKDELTLQPREFRLLEYLMKHAGQVVTRTMLLENVWDYHFDPQTNVIDVHISRLRSKIDKGFERPLLHTIRGAGYMIRDAFGKLIRTTAFRLTLVYLFLFAIFAASLLGYFAWNTRRLINEQIASTVNDEIVEVSDIYARRGLRGLVFTIENRALRPGANLYLVTTPAGQAVAGNVGSLAPGVMATNGWSETVYRRLDEQDSADHRALVRVTELSSGFRLLIGRDLEERHRLFGIVASA